MCRGTKIMYKTIVGGIVSFSVMSSFVINAAENPISYDTELTKTMWKSSWLGQISAKWKTSDIKAKTWWKAEKYEHSIFSVIPEMIANCVTKKNEFDEKQFSKDERRYSVIAFKSVKDKKQYTRANWNAELLCSYVYRVIKRIDDSYATEAKKDEDILQLRQKNYDNCSEEIKLSFDVSDISFTPSQEYLKAAQIALKEYYNHAFDKEIDLAYSDILRYGDDVGLHRYLRSSWDIAEEYRNISAPFAQIFKNVVNEKDGDAPFIVSSYPHITKEESSMEPYKITVTIEADSKLKCIKESSPIYPVEQEALPFTKYPSGTIRIVSRSFNQYGQNGVSDLFELNKDNGDVENILKAELPCHYNLDFSHNNAQSHKDKMIKQALYVKSNAPSFARKKGQDPEDLYSDLLKKESGYDKVWTDIDIERFNEKMNAYAKYLELIHKVKDIKDNNLDEQDVLVALMQFTPDRKTKRYNKLKTQPEIDAFLKERIDAQVKKVYNEIDSEQGISSFMDEDFAKEKIRELKCDRDKSAAFVEEYILSQQE